MMYSLPLLLLIYCNITEGVLEWTVIGKVTDYGQNVTLFCNVSNCCPKDAGWDRWTPHQRTLYIDVKTGRSNKKYDGKVLRDGYTLIIQNLTKDDLNVSYSCLYGVTLGEIKFLQKEDVFSFKSNRHTNFPIDNSEHTEGKITGTTIVVVFVLAIAVFFVIYFTTKYNRIVKKHDQSKEDKISMTPLIGKDKEQEGETNSNMPNEHNDTEGNHGSSTNTLVEAEIDSNTLQSSGLPSSDSKDDRIEVKDVISNNQVPSNSKLFQVWPTDTTNSLAKLGKNTKTHLMKNVQTDRIYDTDPKKQCRVLCILNEKSNLKSIYNSKYCMDVELTMLQLMEKKLGWHIKTYLNKSSSEIIKILEDETKLEYTSVRALFVIVVSSGDQYGIYGTTGRKIKNNEITTKFEQVAGLKDKPKIFILDCCDKKSNIRHHKKFPEDQLDHSKVQKPDRDTNICYKSSENGINIQDEGVMLNAQNLNKTRDGKNVLVTYTRFEHVPDRKLDIYTCIANTLGRCDEIVKGSWVIGALLSVICEAGHSMTFQEMMKEVQIMVTEAVVPEGKPEPKIKIKDCLSKDFYLLPPSP